MFVPQTAKNTTASFLLAVAFVLFSTQKKTAEKQPAPSPPLPILVNCARSSPVGLLLE